MAKLIHRIWMGGPMPAAYRQYGAMWQHENRGDWIVKDWTEEELVIDRDWVCQPVIDHLYDRDAGRKTIELYVQLADVWGYEVLHRYGGVYLNADIQPIRPLSDLRNLYSVGDGPWVAREDSAFVVNCAMGVEEARHPFFRRVLADLTPRYFERPYDEMNQTTGPRLLTDVYNAWLRDGKATPVTALPVHAFNPVHWREVPKGGNAEGMNVHRDTIGLHHWGHKKDGRTNIIEKGKSRV